MRKLHRCLGWQVAALLLWVVPALAAAESFRFRQSITAPDGWTRLVVPDSVLEKCRPQLSDLRILSEPGESPFVLEDRLRLVDAKLEFTNVVNSPGRETLAELDRGVRPALCRSLEIQVADGPGFLKRVVLEGSDDRVTYATLARGSIFRTGEASNLMLGFAPTDKRYLRLRIDDRINAPITPVTATLQQDGERPALDELGIKPVMISGSTSDVDTYALELPASNLLLASLGVEVSDPAFFRTARLYELLMFRGELSRRLISEAVLHRAPNGEGLLQLPVEAIVGRRLELELERNAMPLAVVQFKALVRSRVLLFRAPAGRHLVLAYGSDQAKLPHYDLAAALATAIPVTWNPAVLGAVMTETSSQGSTFGPGRGGTVERSLWQRRQNIQLPRTGTLAYLDLPPAVCRQLPSVRILDPAGAQVPYVLEAEPRRSKARLDYQIIHKSRLTQIRVTHLAVDSPLDAIELTATAPDYFERAIEVTEAVSDARGEIGQRTLARTVWKRSPGSTQAQLSLAIDPPSQSELTVNIDDADNAPLTLSDIAAQLSQRRIDFAFAPSDRLSLYWLNPGTERPLYDLTLIADTLLMSAALPATLGAIEITRTPNQPVPKWFWWATSAAGILVTLVLARTLLSPSK